MYSINHQSYIVPDEYLISGEFPPIIFQLWNKNILKVLSSFSKQIKSEDWLYIVENDWEEADVTSLLFSRIKWKSNVQLKGEVTNQQVCWLIPYMWK